MGAARAPYMAKTDKERLATGFWNRIESNQATDCNTPLNPGPKTFVGVREVVDSPENPYVPPVSGPKCSQ